MNGEIFRGKNRSGQNRSEQEPWERLPLGGRRDPERMGMAGLDHDESAVFFKFRRRTWQPARRWKNPE